MTYAWDNDSTQNAHIKQMRDDRQKAYTEKHRDNKAYERFKHMPDYMGKEYQTMTNREKFAEKILDIACSGGRLAVNKATLEPIACNSLECRDCLFYTECCKGARKKWANSEYVEPPIDWSKVAVDTPILVRDNIFSKWVKRYFAKYENGIVYAWSNGTTSWSGDRCTPWKLAKLPDKEQ
jgi:hypothetical protein|nr:MAG TPA: hypothetical protein [Caudoviricetes sp.]